MAEDEKETDDINRALTDMGVTDDKERKTRFKELKF